MPASLNSRPYVVLNAAMSLDGKIATFTGDSRMSSPADMRRVHRLRASVDAIMVGLRTLLRDDPTIIAVTSRAPKKRIEGLKKMGVTVIVCGRGPLVSLKLLLNRLRSLRIRRILLEGGGTLNWSMLSNQLVDEISVAITPRILGGSSATTLIEGKGNALVRDAIQLKLLGSARYGPDLVVRYKVLGGTNSAI